ncbi:helix-turn-helix transcriptional regulator [Streptomyces tubbatahanensis]|uniref:helix-turn-helix domain-containing protein n=1 Tax=Streptomyces tubbatahanensis TaxID=2923272 RepID=UPI00311B2695
MGTSRKRLDPINNSLGLGADIQRVRKARKISQTAFATVTGYTQSYVSQVESGKILPSVKFAEACDRTFGTGDLFVRQLRRVVDGEYPDWFAPYVEAEREATSIRDFSTTLMMGMFQTREYAQAVLESGRYWAPELDREALLVTRLRRRELLGRANPLRLWVVLHEASLWTQVGSPRITAEQLQHVLNETRRHPTVTVQVLPFDARDVALTAPFAILDYAGNKTVVHVEGPQGGRSYEASDVVSRASAFFDQLRASALEPQASAALISTVRSAHERDMDQVQLQRSTRRVLRRVGPGSRVRRRRRPGAGQ